MRKSNRLVYGIGINEQDRPIREDGKQTKEYKLWCRMLERCNSKFCIKRPTYEGTTCSENFKIYSYFYDWCQEQTGFNNKDDDGKSWHLDKDILLKGNKLYSEDTCVFVPARINTLLIKVDSRRGEFPVGVSWHKASNKFVANCQAGYGKMRHLGLFNTTQDAFYAYKVFKENTIQEIANKYRDTLDKRVYDALINYNVEKTD